VPTGQARVDYNRGSFDKLVPRCILKPAQYRYLCIPVQRDGCLMCQVRSCTRGQSPTLQWRYINVGPHSLIAFSLRRHFQASGAPDVTIRDNVTCVLHINLLYWVVEALHSLLHLLGNAKVFNIPCCES